MAKKESKKKVNLVYIVDFKTKRDGVQTDYIDEAVRYFQNAKDIVKEKCKVDNNGSYTDRKYVREAGHVLWMSCLVALDGFLDIKQQRSEKNKNANRVSIDDYKSATKGYKNLKTFVDNCYDGCHLAMGYDGTKNAKVVKAYFEEAQKLINEVQVQRQIKQK